MPGCSDSPIGGVWDDLYDCSSDGTWSNGSGYFGSTSLTTTGTSTTINTNYMDLFTNDRPDHCPLRNCYTSYYDATTNTNCGKYGFDASLYGVSIDNVGQITVNRDYRMTKSFCMQCQIQGRSPKRVNFDIQISCNPGCSSNDAVTAYPTTYDRVDWEIQETYAQVIFEFAQSDPRFIEGKCGSCDLPIEYTVYDSTQTAAHPDFV